MATVNNSLTVKNDGEKKMGMTAFLNSEKVLMNIEQALGKVDKQRFITSVISAVNTNQTLAECTNASILSAALLGESLKLSPSPQLGHYYMVPFNDKEKGKVATFQLGYKGYIQLAIRSGQYKKLNVMAIKQGELEFFDPLNEDIKINLMVDNWDAREEAETIGYYAFFELTNGFRKAIYWSKKQMMCHADKYSQAFSKDATVVKSKYGEKKKVSYADYEAGNYPAADAWMYSSFWYKDFDGMAYKTMLRQLISKWGIMSIDMQAAFDNDMSFSDESGAKTYVDTDTDAGIIDVNYEEPAPVEEPKAENQAIAPQDVSAVLFG